MENNLSKLQTSAAKLNSKKGFTLLELLIVITILAVLSVAVIVIINPAETIKKARDTQRISDLSSIKTAIALYQSLVTTPYLGGAAANAVCRTSTISGATETFASWASADRIHYSYPTDVNGADTNITDSTLDGGTGSAPADAQVATASIGLVNANGWIPVALTAITTGAPISNFPVDPTNSVSSLTAVASTDLVYRYVCNDQTTNSVLTYEIDATLESTAFTSATSSENKTARDGGNNTSYYETGTNLNILGTGIDF